MEAEHENGKLGQKNGRTGSVAEVRLQTEEECKLETVLLFLSGHSTWLESAKRNGRRW